MALLTGVITGMLVFPIAELKRRYDKGIDLTAILETDPEKVKAHMLFVMQWGHHKGLMGAVEEFNKIFRNYPDWRLQNWEVFRAWYKHEIDFMTDNPHIFTLTVKSDGATYSKEDDPLYDPDAPDWSQYDRKHYDDDNEDDEDDDYDDYNTRRKSSLSDAFAFGAGIGIVGGIIGGNGGCDCGGGCDGGGAIGGN